MSKHYLVVSASIQNEKTVASYKEAAGPIMKKFGGIMPPENFKVTSILAGQLMPQFLLRVEFPSLDLIQKAFSSDEYQKLIEIRDQGFSNLSIYTIEG